MPLHLTAQLAAMGLIVALLPLSLVWASSDARKYRKLVAVTLFLTFDLIVFGGYTRLTDSGLGCPDWPGCYGHANPLQAHAQISAAEIAMPGGPVTVVKAWIEMIHRYLAMAVGVLIVSLMVLAWLQWRRDRRARGLATAALPSALAPQSGPALATLLFGFVCLQGAFGAWTVTMKLQPVIVTIHLLLGMGLLGMLAWLRAQQAVPLQFGEQQPAASRLRGPALLALGLLVLQIALGGWVSTNYATLACTDFPLCHGRVIPEMDFVHGFTLWRQLGMTAAGDYLPFSALTAIHWTHRNFAFVLLAVIAWVGYGSMQIRAVRNLARGLLLAIALQFGTGLATVYFAWPLAIAVAHNAGAALLVLLLVMLNYALRTAGPHAGPRVVTAPGASSPSKIAT